jgi:ABC-type transport system involved in multi-copper enzyme maturation permease subunit
MADAAQPSWVFRAARGLAATVAGPIFIKELRVDSRRRRSYMLRFAYLVLMTLFVAIVWTFAAHEDTSSAMTSYQSADTGRAIIMTITIFQFVSLQLIAVIVMSTSISDEVYHGTMSVLMTTPISNFHVIVGKLSSKLLHVAILVILSVPLLCVVRVFGGVPWEYVLGSSCITLTACAFAGAVTLFYSVLLRRAYMTILASLGTLFFLYIVTSIVLGLLQAILMFASASRNSLWITIPSYANPIWAFALMTGQSMQPGSGGTATFVWPIHCLLMLGLTAGISLICVPMVRRVSLKRAMGGNRSARDVTLPLSLPNSSSIPPVAVPPPPDAPVGVKTADGQPNDADKQAGPNVGLPVGAVRSSRSELVGMLTTVTPPPLPTVGAPPVPVTPYSQAPANRQLVRKDRVIHRVKGSAIIWKETRGAWVFRGVWSLVSLVLCLSILVLIDTLVGILGGLDKPEYHAGVMAVLMALAIVVVSVTAATTISTEKESRSLPVLLTTPMGDGQIILGKFVGVLRRCIGTFIPMTAQLILFVLAGLGVRGYVRPIALGHMALIIAPMLWFYISSGLYFGSKFKKTTAAVVLNLGLAMVLLLLLPIVTGLTRGGSRVLDDGNPVVQTAIMVAGDGWVVRDYSPSPGPGDIRDVRNYSWPSENRDSWGSMVELLTWALVYFVAGSVFLWRARANLRKKLF